MTLIFKTSFKTITVKIEASVCFVIDKIYPVPIYWRKKWVIRIDIDDSKGKIYTFQDCANRKNTCTFKIFASSKYAMNHSLCT
jgi:hypothetical protein